MYPSEDLTRPQSGGETPFCGTMGSCGLWRWRRRRGPWHCAPPFVIAQRTAHQAQNVRVTVRTEDGGLSGLGESAPVGYVTGESVASVLAALDAVGPEFVGQSGGTAGAAAGAGRSPAAGGSGGAGGAGDGAARCLGAALAAAAVAVLRRPAGSADDGPDDPHRAAGRGGRAGGGGGRARASGTSRSRSATRRDTRRTWRGSRPSRGSRRASACGLTPTRALTRTRPSSSRGRWRRRARRSSCWNSRWRRTTGGA